MTHVWQDRFNEPAADGIPLSARTWFEHFDEQLKEEYLLRYRSNQPSALDFAGWCFKQYERYCENHD